MSDSDLFGDDDGDDDLMLAAAAEAEAEAAGNWDDVAAEEDVFGGDDDDEALLRMTEEDGSSEHTPDVPVDPPDKKCLSALKRHFGHDSFKPMQWQIVDTVLKGER